MHNFTLIAIILWDVSINRFKDKENLPENREAIEKLHTDIQSVRIPRQAEKRLTYAFIEFSSETKCENAKVILQSPYMLGIQVDFSCWVVYILE